MAMYDGSGDISFTPDEFRQVGEAIIEASMKALPGQYLTVCIGVSGQADAFIEVREPRFRGPVDELGFQLRPYRG